MAQQNNNEIMLLEEFECVNNICECRDMSGNPQVFLIAARFYDAKVFMENYVTKNGDFSEHIFENEEYKKFLDNAKQFCGETNQNILLKIGKKYELNLY